MLLFFVVVVVFFRSFGGLLSLSDSVSSQEPVKQNRCAKEMQLQFINAQAE